MVHLTCLHSLCYDETTANRTMSWIGFTISHLFLPQYPVSADTQTQSSSIHRTGPKTFPTPAESGSPHCLILVRYVQNTSLALYSPPAFMPLWQLYIFTTVGSIQFFFLLPGDIQTKPLPPAPQDVKNQQVYSQLLSGDQAPIPVHKWCGNFITRNNALTLLTILRSSIPHACITHLDT